MPFFNDKWHSRLVLRVATLDWLDQLNMHYGFSIESLNDPTLGYAS